MIETNHKKLFASCIMMPVLADFLEDVLNDEQMRDDIIDKHLANNIKTVIKKLIKADSRLIDNADIQSIEEQNNVKLKLRQFFEL
jgi:hypothetical protein